MQLLMDTAAYPAHERFDAWLDLVGRAVAPITITAADPTAYVGRLAGGRYGQVNVVSMSSSSCVGRRTPRLINQHDLDAVQVMLVARGTTHVVQNGAESTLRPGDLAIFTTRRPYATHAEADGTGLVTGTTALVPRHRLPLSTQAIDQLSARAIPGRSGGGALLAGLLAGLPDQPEPPPAAAERLACAFTDLLTVTLGSAADQLATVPPETVHNALFARVTAYIGRHLADPALTPAAIAAAHHLSTRSLHRLFESHGETVSGFVRRGRLDRCGADLRDPALRHRPVQDIAARWGFRSASHFTRRFQEQTGMPPSQYRRASLTKRTAHPRHHPTT